MVMGVIQIGRGAQPESDANVSRVSRQITGQLFKNTTADVCDNRRSRRPGYQFVRKYPLHSSIGFQELVVGAGLASSTVANDNNYGFEQEESICREM